MAGMTKQQSKIDYLYGFTTSFFDILLLFRNEKIRNQIL